MEVAQNEPIKIGVVGVGFGSRVQIPGFLKIPGVEVAAVMSSGRYERAAEVARQFGINTVCRTFEELLEVPGLDAVSIVTPPYQHRELTLAALQAGKHVLCEKPMARSLEEAREMRNAGRQSGLVTMLDHEFRYVPARAYVKELIDEGWLGQLYQARISFTSGLSADPQGRPWGWLFDKEAGGGFLGALGSHYIDAMRYWFGEIAGVCATIETLVKHRTLPGQPDQWREVTADDTFMLLLRFAGSGLGTINVSVVSRFGEGERMEFYGSEGTLVIDSEGRLLGGKAGEDQRLRALPIPARYNDGPSSDDPRLRPFVTLASDFIKAIRQHKQTGNAFSQEVSPNFNDGFKVQQVIDAAHQSAEMKCWVSLPPPR
jgi:predicted dehydrogenase